MAEATVERLLLIVVGAHLRAEVADRPLAYGLRDRMIERLDGGSLAPVVCCDVWYLNRQELHARPTVSIGGPSVNALSAYFYPRLPTALEVEQRLAVQIDVDLGDLRVNLWGSDAIQTATAVQLFESRYLDGYLRAAVR